MVYKNEILVKRGLIGAGVVGLFRIIFFCLGLIELIKISGQEASLSIFFITLKDSLLFLFGFEKSSCIFAIIFLVVVVVNLAVGFLVGALIFKLIERFRLR